MKFLRSSASRNTNANEFVDIVTHFCYQTTNSADKPCDALFCPNAITWLAS